jgi:hypothetical protein
MSVIDTNDTNSHYQQNHSAHINPNNFADQESLSSVFACNNNIENKMNKIMNNIMNNSMENNMNNSMIDNMNNILDVTRFGRTTLGSSPDKNKLLLKHILGRNTRDFKGLVANFCVQPQNNDYFQQSQTLPNQTLKNTMSSSDVFGNFHPIELSSNKNSNFMNGEPSAYTDMRIPLENPSSAAPMFAAGIDKNHFRPYSPLRQFNKNKNNMGSSSNGMENSSTQSMSNFATSRRVSMCSSSVISDDSNHSHHSVKVSPTAVINAATNIVNGNELESVYNMNDNLNNIMTMDPIPSSHNHIDASLGDNNSNVVSEPGPYDIVCGRNSGAYNYIGNRRFRVTIEMNLQQYIYSPTREDKTNVIKSIVWMLHEQVSARFLKKETSKKSSGSRRRGTPRYTVMTDKQAREKVGHALRDLVITARKEQQKEK